MSEKTSFIFFGGEPLGAPILNSLHTAGLMPELIVCNPDRPVGRKQIITPPPVKQWASQHNIPVFQPESCKKREELDPITNKSFDLFVVVAYNQILPKWLINLPHKGTINVHPSLLPTYRGASPIRSAILNDDRQTGVTVMQMDEKMDHGSIIAQENIDLPVTNWPMSGPDLDMFLAKAGGELLAKTIPSFVAGEITPTEQNHDLATYCGKITKDMALLQVDPYNLPTGDEAYATFLKIQAYAGWPVAFFVHDDRRFKVTEAHLEGSKLVIDKVVPEGKDEVSFSNVFK